MHVTAASILCRVLSLLPRDGLAADDKLALFGVVLVVVGVGAEGVVRGGDVSLPARVAAVDRHLLEVGDPRGRRALALHPRAEVAAVLRAEQRDC